MARSVDPKNASQRDSEGWRLSAWFQGLLPDRLYVREILLGLLALVIGYVIYDFSAYVSSSEQYRASVKVVGLEALSRNAVLDEIEDVIGTEDERRSLVGISVDEIRETLLKRIPRFKRVQVRKDYPGTLLVEVEERTPVALIARRTSGKNSKVYLPIDREGVVFRPTAREVKELPETVPVIKGFPEVQEGTPSFRRRWTKALNVLEAVDQRFDSNLLEWVQIRTGGYVQIRISHPKSINVRLGETRYGKKLDKLKEMMQTNQFLEIKKYVNLTQLQNVRAL